MAYTDDQMGPRRRALVDGLAGNTGISGAMPGGAGVPPIAGATPDQQRALGTQADQVTSLMGPQAAPAAEPKYAPIAGFDFDKITGKKAYDSKEKYSDALRNYSQALGSGVAIGRNNLGGVVDYAKAHGFAGAKAVGDDKIDYGDGAGAIDVIRANGEPWFQNGPDRFAQAPAAAGGARPMFAGSTVAPMLQGDAQSNIQQAMQQMGSLSDPSRLQQLIAALQGGGQ